MRFEDRKSSRVNLQVGRPLQETLPESGSRMPAPGSAVIYERLNETRGPFGAGRSARSLGMGHDARASRGGGRRRASSCRSQSSRALSADPFVRPRPIREIQTGRKSFRNRHPTDFPGSALGALPSTQVLPKRLFKQSAKGPTLLGSPLLRFDQQLIRQFDGRFHLRTA